MQIWFYFYNEKDAQKVQQINRLLEQKQDQLLLQVEETLSEVPDFVSDTPIAIAIKAEFRRACLEYPAEKEAVGKLTNGGFHFGHYDTVTVRNIREIKQYLRDHPGTVIQNEDGDEVLPDDLISTIRSCPAVGIGNGPLIRIPPAQR